MLPFRSALLFGAPSEGEGGGALVPPWTNVKLLCGFNGSFTDESSFAHGLSTFGTPTTTTSDPKFGTHCFLGDGAGDSLSDGNSADWSFGTGDFTLETFVKVTSNKLAGFLGYGTNGAGDARWCFGTDSFGVLEFRHGAVGSAIVNGGSGLSGTGWRHCAVCRASGTTRLFVDGVMVDSSTASYDIVTAGSIKLEIGTDPQSSFGRAITGRMDETRIVKGFACYPSDAGFTPPTAEFPRS